jgi:hypothetical protein
MTPPTVMSIRDLGELIAATFRLGTKPIAVHGSDTPPEGAVFLPSVHRCLATAMIRMSKGEAPSVVYLGEDAKAGCCPGGLSHAGYIRRPPAISYFVSSGNPAIPDAPAEYLKATPELVDACFAAEGAITPPGRYLVVRTTESVPDPFTGVRAISFFGRADRSEPVAQVPSTGLTNLPCPCSWGPACATWSPIRQEWRQMPRIQHSRPQDPTSTMPLPRHSRHRPSGQCGPRVANINPLSRKERRIF